MRLVEFIRHEHDAILAEWVQFARTLHPSGEGMSVEALTDNGPALLKAIVRQMEVQLSGAAEGVPAHEVTEPSGHHALRCLEEGLDLRQLISEYRALRTSVLRLWTERQDPAGDDPEGIRIFNDTMDEALAEAAYRYTTKIHELKDEFMGVLGHDLGNPLSAILITSKALLEKTPADQPACRRLARIVTSAERMQRMIRDVLVLTRRRFHRPLPLQPKETDLGPLCRDIVAELCETHPERHIEIQERGDLCGQWDSDRICEVVSNLVGNALQHGVPGSPVDVLLVGNEPEVVLTIRNQGETIPDEDMDALFEPFRRGVADQAETNGHLGLGLFIAREIVTAHAGHIDVASSKTEGTTFTVHLPRHRDKRDEAR